jgi:hypothetical protein
MKKKIYKIIKIIENLYSDQPKSKPFSSHRVYYALGLPSKATPHSQNYHFKQLPSARQHADGPIRIILARIRPQVQNQDDFCPLSALRNLKHPQIYQI